MPESRCPIHIPRDRLRSVALLIWHSASTHTPRPFYRSGKTVKRLPLFLTVILLPACASLQSDYEDRLLRTLPNQREVTFGDQVIYPGKVMCGAYTTLSSNGFSKVTRRFVVGPDFVLGQPTDIEKKVYCSRDPVSAFRELTGISVVEGDFTAMSKISRDLATIDGAILVYYNTNATLPRKLNELLTGEYGANEGDLIDPWARPYHYESGLAGRTTPQFTLETLGADGVRGGTGADADVSYDQAGLLRHVLSIAAE